MRRPLIEVKAPRREPPLGVLLVSGAHTHQEMYAASFAADERCRLVGLTDERQIDDRRRGLNLLLAARLGVPWFDDLDAALARDDVSIACICAEPERRAPLIVRAARAGKHVYLDKPLAASICEAEAIVSAIEKSQVISQMYSMVGWRVAQRLRAAIESGEVGQPLALHYDLFFAKGHTGTARLSDAQPREKQPTDFERFDAKRELYNIGVYPLVTLAWLFRTGVARVTATTGNYFFAEHQARGFEDFAQVVVECADGLLATINVGRTGWHSHPSAGVHRATLIGSRGRITADLHSPRIETWSAMSRWDAPARHTADPAAFWPSTQQESGIRPKTAWTNPYELGDDVRRFVDFVERGQASDVDASLAADVLEWLLAAYQSAAEGRAVNLPLPRDG